MKNGVVNGGKKGKSQGIEGNANANDVWVWMRLHIRFDTIGKCDLLSFFLLIESLSAACKFSSIFLKHGAFQMRFHLFFFSILDPLSFEDPSFAMGDSTHWNFPGESIGK
jgi:hypothetical protein